MRESRGANKTLISCLRIGLGEEEMFAHIRVPVYQLLLVCLLWGRLCQKAEYHNQNCSFFYRVYGMIS